MKTLTVEMIESLCGPASPRPWSILFGESGEGTIGDATGEEIVAASMADCTLIVRAVNDADALHSDLARVTAERDRLAEREALFIKALSPVCDAGQYRADVVSAIQRITAERDALRAEVEAMRAVVEAATDAVDAVRWPKQRKALLSAIDALRARKVPDHACVTTPDGDCVAAGPCMHSPPTKADAYFAQAKEVAAEVDNWPEWKKAGFVRKVGG